ncbi:MAG: hypothetical protein JKY93_03345 [Gammaproteobacteria bacterium]|nr:hypothetical protein [Gammaproteobacteria bacterium]
MHIKSTELLTAYDKQQPASFTIDPTMGVVKTFPSWACLQLIEKGAVEVPKNVSAKSDAAQLAK